MLQICPWWVYSDILIALKKRRALFPGVVQTYRRDVATSIFGSVPSTEQRGRPYSWDAFRVVDASKSDACSNVHWLLSDRKASWHLYIAWWHSDRAKLSSYQHEETNHLSTNFGGCNETGSLGLRKWALVVTTNSRARATCLQCTA